MMPQDMPSVLKIENSCFEYAWTEDDFYLAFSKANCMRMVAEVDGTVVGFMVYELKKTSLILVDIAVHPDLQRRGFGTAMIARLQAKLNDKTRRDQIILGVRETNLEAQLFFRQCGFLATEIIGGYFDDFHEDAYKFVYEVASIEDQMIGLSKDRSQAWGAGA